MRLCGNNERSHSFTSASLIGAHFFIFLDTISGGHNMKQKFLVVLFIFSIISTFVSCGDKDHDTLSVVSEEMVFSEISWPDNEFTNLIPTPKSKMGNISSDSSYGFLFILMIQQKKIMMHMLMNAKIKVLLSIITKVMIIFGPIMKSDIVFK